MPQSHPLSKSEAQSQFDNLPARFRASVVGQIYQQVLNQLEDDGQVQAEVLLAKLFPDEDPLTARRELSTRYINRAYKDDNGNSPLRMCMTRPSRKQPTASVVWFESDAAAPTMHMHLDPPRYLAAQFTEALAESVTSEEIAGASTDSAPSKLPPRIQQAENDMAMSLRDSPRPLHGLTPQSLRTGVAGADFEEALGQLSIGLHQPGYEGDGFRQSVTSEEIAGASTDSALPKLPTRIQQAELDMALSQRSTPRPLHGLTPQSLRREVAGDAFQDASAHHSTGLHQREHEGDELRRIDVKVRRKHNKSLTPDVEREPVNALQAMLDWALASDKQGQPKHRLLALLGDYGTGKTSHAYQFTRVLNGQVLRDSWTQACAKLPAKRQPPTALMIDLAELADVRNLPALDLVDMVSIVLRKKNPGALLDTAGSSYDTVAQQAVANARSGALVFVFDGLDELLKNDRSVLIKVFDQLLRVLEPSQEQLQKNQPSKARVIVSCRTHYFRDAADQWGFFNTRQRGIAQASEYLRLTLLPWGNSDVQSYLRKRLDPAQADQLLHTINTTYNLQELASRPVLLAMMSEQLGALLRVSAQGEPITASRMYAITVSEWVQRDGGKHRLKAAHKPLVMGALASAMWSEGTEAWEVEQLDRWLLRTVKTLFPDQYDATHAEAIQDDLRTATFIVRPGAERFSFAHRSFAEYFLARFFWDALWLRYLNEITDAQLRSLLTDRPLNAESLQFLQEIWQEQGSRHSPDTWATIATPLWRLLQDGSQAPPNVPAPALHAMLWDLALALQLPAPPASASPACPWEPTVPLNLRGLQLVDAQWQDLDLRALPPLDCRGTNLLALRAHRCQFGQVHCDAHTSWAQALLRDCDTDAIVWGESDRTGLAIRHGDIRHQWKKATPAAPLPGPWANVVPRSAIDSVAISPDGRTVLTGSGDRTARLWDAASGQVLRTFTGHSAGVISVAFSCDGRTVLTGSRDGTARLWDAASGQVLRTFTGHSDRVSSVAFSGDGRTVLTGSRDGTARVWDAASGQVLRTFTGHSDGVSSVAFSGGGRTVLTGSWDRTARLWDAASGQVLRTFTGHSYRVTSVAFSGDGRLVLTGSGDDTARLWDAASGQVLRTFTVHDGLVTSAALSGDGRTVLTGSHASTARLWDAASGQVLRTFTGRSSGVNSVALSGDGRTVLTGSYDGTADLWDAASGRVLRTFTGRSSGANSVALSGDGRTVLTGSYDHTARLWDAASGQVLHPLTGHRDQVTSVAFSSDGRTVLTGSYDGTARLWDAASGQVLRTFTGHDDWVSSVAFSGDGRTVLTGSYDGTARLWDAASAQTLLTFTGHGDRVSSVAFSGDGRSVLLATDGCARWIDLEATQEGQAHTRVFVHGRYAPSTALFDVNGSLIDCDNEAADTWLMHLGQGTPQPIEAAFSAQPFTPSTT